MSAKMGPIHSGEILPEQLKDRFRRYLVHHFPCAVIYAIEEDVIHVAAVMQLKRKPDLAQSGYRYLITLSSPMPISGKDSIEGVPRSPVLGLHKIEAPVGNALRPFAFMCLDSEQEVTGVIERLRNQSSVNLRPHT